MVTTRNLAISPFQCLKPYGLSHTFCTKHVILNGKIWQWILLFNESRCDHPVPRWSFLLSENWEGWLSIKNLCMCDVCISEYTNHGHGHGHGIFKCAQYGKRVCAWVGSVWCCIHQASICMWQCPLLSLRWDAGWKRVGIGCSYSFRMRC